MSKLCRKCGITKALSEFVKNKDRYQYLCKACKRNKENKRYGREEVKQKYQAYWVRAKLSHKDRFFKRTYGISLEDYQNLLKQQNNACAICERQESVLDKRTKEPRRLAVDHDHETGTIRGLLCMSCNVGLGKFGDNQETLRKALNYLENKCQ